MPHEKRKKASNEEFRARVKEINERNAAAKGNTAVLPFGSGTTTTKPRNSTRRARHKRGSLKQRMETDLIGQAKWPGLEFDDPKLTNPKVKEARRLTVDKPICYSCGYWDHPGGCLSSIKIDRMGTGIMRHRLWNESCNGWRRLTKKEARQRGYDEA